MIRAEDFDRVLDTWLTATAPVTAPPNVHKRAMVAVAGRRQRVSWSATLRSTTTDLRLVGGIRVGSAARFAALVALASVVVMVISLAGGSGRPPIGPSQSQTPAPSPSLSISPSPALSPTPLRSRAGVTAPYFLTPFTYNEPDPPNLVRITDGRDIQEFISSADASRGVVIGALGLPWLHACEGSPLDDVRATPAEFLDDLQNLGGLTTDPVAATTFDGRAALTTAFRAGASRCTPDFHVTYDDTRASKVISVRVASQLTVLQVGVTTIVVDTWAQSDDALQTWLPTALDFVDSIHFLDQPAGTFDLSARDFLGYLHGYAQAFTPNDPPEGLLDWHDAVWTFPFVGAEVEAVQYGTVTCINPAQGLKGTCALGRPGRPLNIWLVTFADVPAFQGCPVWASVNAETADFINGSGPSC